MAFDQITYVSRSRLDDDKDEALLDAGDIAIYSAVRNRASDVGGILYFDGRYFAQVLEGPPATVRRLLYRIARDRRHEQMTLIGKRRVEERAFKDWSMGLITDAASSLEILRKAFGHTEQGLSDYDHAAMIGQSKEMIQATEEEPHSPQEDWRPSGYSRYVFWDHAGRSATDASLAQGRDPRAS